MTISKNYQMLKFADTYIVAHIVEMNIQVIFVN